MSTPYGRFAAWWRISHTDAHTGSDPRGVNGYDAWLVKGWQP